MNLDQVHRLMATQGVLLEFGETVRCYECLARETESEQLDVNPLGIVQIPSVCRTCGRRGPSIMRLEPAKQKKSWW